MKITFSNDMFTIFHDSTESLPTPEEHDEPFNGKVVMAFNTTDSSISIFNYRSGEWDPQFVEEE